jgi:hypothetical protein
LDNLKEGFSHRLEVLVSVSSGKPVVFDLTPQELNEVEFRTVRRKKLDIEIFFLPSFNLFFEFIAGMNRCIINDHERRLSPALAEEVEAVNDRAAINRTFKSKGTSAFIAGRDNVIAVAPVGGPLRPRPACLSIGCGRRQMW